MLSETLFEHKVAALRESEIERIRIDVRRLRAEQIRRLFVEGDSLTSGAFRVEILNFETRSVFCGQDLTRRLFETDLSQSELCTLQAALMCSDYELHGNYLWHPLTNGNDARASMDKRLVRTPFNEVVRVLRDRTMYPVEKYETLRSRFDVSPVSATGLLMLWNPERSPIWRGRAAALLRAANITVSSLERYWEVLAWIKDQLKAQDYFEVDRLLEVLASERGYSDIADPLLSNPQKATRSRKPRRQSQSRISKSSQQPEAGSTPPVNAAGTNLYRGQYQIPPRTKRKSIDQPTSRFKIHQSFGDLDRETRIQRFKELCDKLRDVGLELRFGRIAKDDVDICTLLEHARRIQRRLEVDLNVARRATHRREPLLPEMERIRQQASKRLSLVTHIALYRILDEPDVAKLQMQAFGMSYLKFFQWQSWKALRSGGSADDFFAWLLAQVDRRGNLPLSDQETVGELKRASSLSTDSLFRALGYMAFENHWDEALCNYVAIIPEQSDPVARLVVARERLRSEIGRLPTELISALRIAKVPSERSDHI